ncbi:MAG: hypothetical protein WDW36_000706 [Sanguina aurantia]
MVAQSSCVLFYLPQLESLARGVAAAAPDRIALGDVSWRRFPDAFPNLAVRDAPRLRDRHVVFLASFEDPGTIFEQLSLMYSLPLMFIASFTVCLPYLPACTLEKLESQEQVSTAATLARLLSDIPGSRGGPTALLTFDIHALQERFYFKDSLQPLLLSAVPLLLRRLEGLPDADNVVIAYPDEGAYKRFHLLLEGFTQLVCTRVKQGSERIVILKEGDPKGKHVVIIDDLAQSGTTLLACRQVMYGAGAADVSAFVTHAVLPQNAWQRLTRLDPLDPGNAVDPDPASCVTASAEDRQKVDLHPASSVVRPVTHVGGSEKAEGYSKGYDDHFRHVWLTDSCPRTALCVAGVAPFEVLSLSGLIAEALTS